MELSMMKIHSFIFNFKKHVMIIFKIILFILFCVFLSNSFKYILIDDTKNYTRLTLHDMYNEKNNIDILFLGSSHCYRSLNPQITDSIFKKNTFNLGTSGQFLDGTYTLLVEAEKNNNLKEVYIDLYYDILGNDIKNRTELTSTYIISDYLKPSLNKYRYILESSNNEYWINGILIARRKWKNYFNNEYKARILEKKDDISYKNYDRIFYENEYYDNKGFVANTEQVDSFINYDNFNNISKLSSSDIKYIKKIIKFCKKKNIKLVFFSSPMSDYMLIDNKNYDDYIIQIKDLLKDYKIDYYDFNLLKEDVFDSTNEKYFKDNDHLNFNGANELSKIFSDFFTGKISKNDIFYSTYKEKIDNMSPQIFGIIVKKNILKNNIKVNLEPISNTSSNIKYKIYDNNKIFQNFDSKNYFILNTNYRNKITIETKLNNIIYKTFYLNIE